MTRGPIGYVLRYWPTMSETFVAREIRALQARGTQVDVAAIGRRMDPRPGEAVEVPTFRPPRGWRSAQLALSAWRGVRQRAGRQAMATLSDRLRPKDALRVAWLADVGRRRGWTRLHAHFAGEAAVWAAGAAQILGVPYSVTVHAVDLFKPRDDLAAVLSDADPVITICDHHRRWIAERYGLQAHVVRCGVDPEAYAPADPAQGRFPWVCVARDVPKKGLDQLVAARRQVGGVLRLVSDAVRLGGPGVLAGPVAAGEVPKILARAEAFVLPCRVGPGGDRDGVPVALMEAMAAGLPVITTPISGIVELVDETVGWWVAPDDPSDLVRVLREVRLNPAERVARGRAGRARIREAGWTVDQQADALLKVFCRSVAQ